jgi:hypothetical protein
MIPKFLAPEVIPYASVEIIPAPQKSSATAMVGNPADRGETARSCVRRAVDGIGCVPSVFALFVENPATGYQQVLTFPSRFDRTLHIVTLSAQPLVLTTADY